MSSYTMEEDALLAMLKKMYWKDSPQITRCQSQMYFSNAWPGRPDSLPSLQSALSSLVGRGYLKLEDQRYCLTEAGEQAIGAKPVNNSGAA
jgi:hypothetical protein